MVPADTRPPRARSLWRDRPLSVSGMVDERRALVGAESSATCTVSMDMEPVSSMPVVTATRSASLMTTAEDDPVRERTASRRCSWNDAGSAGSASRARQHVAAIGEAARRVFRARAG
ncbi:MAG: hypothetical protein IPG17_27620 [Sandaracinaceae bacterium]|nr:hypothetical protein [Sandaracinaceae bacterium]